MFGINLRSLQGEVTITEDEFDCRFCKQEALIVYVHDFIGELVWEGCANCLIDKIQEKDHKYRNVKDRLEKALNRKDVDCMCNNVSLGCKCGAMVREKYLKKLGLYHPS